MTLDTVVITLYDLSDGTTETLDDNSCTEIQTTGYFKFALAGITTYPTEFTEYLYKMNSSGSERWGKVILSDLDDLANGAEAVTVTVLDGDSNPVVGADIQCFNSAQTVLLDRKSTDANGQVVFALDDGSYKLRCAKAQVSFTVPETLTVSGTTAKAVTAEVLTLSTPAASDVCRVFGYAYNQAGSNPLSSLKAVAKITTLPMSANSKMHVGAEVKATYEPSTGLFYFDIVQGAVCLFKCDDLGISYTRTVPSSATARLSSIAA